jgi:very-short-patch-repair endonuclease
LIARQLDFGLFYFTKMNGIYTANDVSKEIFDLYYGNVNSPRKWEHNLSEFKTLDIFTQRKELSKCYELLMPYILQRKANYINPYILDWNGYLNANEFTVFCVCRCLGVAFYPQFSVDRFCLDFANPYYKIGIEVDSNTYHTYEKDLKRDIELKKLGWKIYHLTSAEAYSNSKQNMEDIYLEYDYLSEEEYFENKSRYYQTQIEGIIECISYACFGFRIEEGFEDIARLVAYNHLILK